MSSIPDHAIPSLLPGRQDPLVMMWGLEGGEERCKKNQTKIILAVVRWLDHLVCQKKMYWQQIERQDLLKSSRVPASAALPLSTVKGASYIPQRSFRTIVLFSEKLKSSRSILSKLLFSCQQL